MKILTSILITVTVLIIFLLTLFLYIQYKAAGQTDGDPKSFDRSSKL